MSPSVQGAASRASRNPALRAGARLGYAASGVLHLVLAWLAVQLAWGSSSAPADSTGALQELGEHPVGGVLLWVVVVGFALLGAWQATEAVVADGAKDTAAAAGRAVVFLALAVLAARVATGSGGGGGEKRTTDVTAAVMEHPLGRVAVGAVGIGILVAGVVHVVRGWRRTFLANLRERPPRAVVVAGRLGYVAKGLALGVVGVLFLAAALQDDPQEAGGMDAALTSLLDLPAGPWILTAVGLGIACYGVFSFARARYADV